MCVEQSQVVVCVQHVHIAMLTTVEQISCTKRKKKKDVQQLKKGQIMRHSSFYDSKRNKEKLPNKRTTRKERGSSFGPNALFFLLLFSFSVFRPFIVNKFLVIHHVFNVFFFVTHPPLFFPDTHICAHVFFFGKGAFCFCVFEVCTLIVSHIFFLCFRSFCPMSSFFFLLHLSFSPCFFIFFSLLLLNVNCQSFFCLFVCLISSWYHSLVLALRLFPSRTKKSKGVAQMKQSSAHNAVCTCSAFHAALSCLRARGLTSF